MYVCVCVYACMYVQTYLTSVCMVFAGLGCRVNWVKLSHSIVVWRNLNT